MSILRLSDLPPPPCDRTGWPWTVESYRVPDKPQTGASWPKISIVTTNYNYGQYIEETIRSVLLQGYPDVEYVVLDGGSSDASVDVLRKYSPWLSYWKSEPDKGQVDALNRGLRMTTGVIVNWLNSDDLLLPGALSAIANLWNLDRSIDLISGARIFRCQTGVEEIDLPWTRRWPEICLGMPFLPQETTFFSRRLWSIIGCLDERFNYGFDTAFFTEALKSAEKVVLTSVPIAIMRVHPDQKTLNADYSTEDKILESEYYRWTSYSILKRLLRTRAYFVVEALLQIWQHGKAKNKLYHGSYNHSRSTWRLSSFS
jgi:glycosyltransferase involved in cell wall biosynthesis